jgi:hypothetical protein
MNPQADKIHRLLEGRGEAVINDHIAFRTYRSSQVGIDRFQKVFEKYSYRAMGEYYFKEKKLYARHYENQNAELPKIFVSELMVDQLSNSAQKLIDGLLAQVADDFCSSAEFLYAGRPWKLGSQVYQDLMKETEYGAWLSAFGFRANHFTVNVNRLKTFDSLNALNLFLKENGFPLNASGGEIKGGPQAFLEQSSTMAARISVAFDDRSLEIPSCYYEFAKRYPLENGKLYQGFVETSADKIFESTDQGKSV